jgi:hypothetical protein
MPKEGTAMSASALPLPDPEPDPPQMPPGLAWRLAQPVIELPPDTRPARLMVLLRAMADPDGSLDAFREAITEARLILAEMDARP